jgi:ABC-2 type transport system ATP-binding protein
VTVSVAVHGADDVRRHLDALDDAGVPVERLALATPTLDDVFLALTGTVASTAAPGDAPVGATP